jgi:DNA replication initiation complex subunit (GINS family)
MVISALEVNEFTISNLIVENRKFLNLIKKCANTEKHKIKEAIKDIKGIRY